jgi:hypothetical protein
MPEYRVTVPASGLWSLPVGLVASGDTPISVRQAKAGEVSEAVAAVIRRAPGPPQAPWLLAGGVWSNAGAWRNDAVWTN